MEQKEQYIYVEPEPYSTDVLAMLRSFFPERNLKVIVPESREEVRAEADRSGLFCSVICRGEQACIRFDGREYHFPEEALEERAEDMPEETPGGKEISPAFKKALGAYIYRMLEKTTGRTLPWGNLNGVRPTKPAFYGLQKGESREQILRYYLEEHYVSREKAELSIDIAQRELGVLEQIRHGDAGYTAGYSLYIGIPFCPTTCLYCSFTSFPIAGYRNLVDAYIDALIREIRATAEMMHGRGPDSVYIGGGTPTTLEPAQSERLIRALEEEMDLSGCKEFTVEAGRADSITQEKLEVFRRHGVTRISINAQTMKQETLDFIGRRASVEQVREAYRIARRLGFDNINMDLILGLPGEGAGDVRETMRQVRELAPESLTVHSLAIKRASRLARWIEENGMPAEGNTDETMAIAAEGAAAMGLYPYYLYRQKNMSGNFENVGYAAPGKYGLYNVLMMEEIQSVIALGAGTITKRVDARKGADKETAYEIRRSENVKDVKLYLEQTEEMIDRKRELFR